MSHSSNSISSVPMEGDDTSKAKLAAVGGILGAVGASACCIAPLVLFSLGVGGAWIGRLTSLSPYQPIFIAITFGFLGYGYWLIYRRQRIDCADGAACAQALPNRLVKSALWLATALVLIAIAWPVVVPIFLG